MSLLHLTGNVPSPRPKGSGLELGPGGPYTLCGVGGELGTQWGQGPAVGWYMACGMSCSSSM